MHAHIYIYIYREREREIDRYWNHWAALRAPRFFPVPGSKPDATPSGTSRQVFLVLVKQEDMSSCVTRRNAFVCHKKTGLLFHMKTCPLVSQVDMPSCATSSHVYFCHKETWLLVSHEDMSSCVTRRLARESLNIYIYIYMYIYIYIWREREWERERQRKRERERERERQTERERERGCGVGAGYSSEAR